LLPNNPIGTPFIELHTVESTNNYAMGLVHEGLARHGTAVFAHEQTRGKGQRDRQWLSAKDQNIALSVVVEPAGIAISGSFLLSMCVAVAAHRFVSKHLGDEVRIKWPNDIYWRDRKAGGILIENLLQGSSWRFAVAGIGLNINQTEFPQLETKAVSFRQVTGNLYQPLFLAKELCVALQENLQQLNNSAAVAAAYRAALYKKNERVKLRKDNRVFDATIKDVTLMGELVVQHATEEKFAVGEVEWLLH